MQLNEAVSARLKELLQERSMTQYQLYMKSGVPKSSIGNTINCSYDSVKLCVTHDICQGLEINVSDFFNFPYFDETNLEPETNTRKATRTSCVFSRSRQLFYIAMFQIDHFL
jgi:DNA-binding Xre family transcriptional regulator